jgi:hypothetical protein
MDLKNKYPGVKIIGPSADRSRIPGIDEAFGDGQSFSFGPLECKVRCLPINAAGKCYVPVCVYFLRRASLVLTLSSSSMMMTGFHSQLLRLGHRFCILKLVSSYVCVGSFC